MGFVWPQTPDFRFLGWELVFGRFQWFYVVGGRSLLARARLGDYSYAKEAVQLIQPPEDWLDYRGPFQWDELAGNQVLRAIHGKPQRFDKAALSILAIVAAVKANGNADFVAQCADANASDFVRIKAATFEIPGFDVARQQKIRFIAGFREKQL